MVKKLEIPRTDEVVFNKAPDGGVFVIEARQASHVRVQHVSIEDGIPDGDIKFFNTEQFFADIWRLQEANEQDRYNFEIEMGSLIVTAQRYLEDGYFELRMPVSECRIDIFSSSS